MGLQYSLVFTPLNAAPIILCKNHQKINLSGEKYKGHLHPASFSSQSNIPLLPHIPTITQLGPAPSSPFSTMLVLSNQFWSFGFDTRVSGLLCDANLQRDHPERPSNARASCVDLNFFPHFETGVSAVIPSLRCE